VLKSAPSVSIAARRRQNRSARAGDLWRGAGCECEAKRTSPVVIQYVIVDGAEGEQVAARQGEAIREVLAWVYAHAKEECRCASDGNE
jgi:hypothetical protein